MKWWGWCVVAAEVLTVATLVAVLCRATPLWGILAITGLTLCIVGLIGLMIEMVPK